MSRDPDVLVIGGGVIGLACAENLARQGLRVLVVERGRCGQEASWAAAGIIQFGRPHRRDALVRLQRESLRRYPAWTASLAERTGIDPEFTSCGSLEALLDENQVSTAGRELRASEESRDEYGQPTLELLTPEQARELEPHLAEDLLAVKFSRLTGQVRSPRLLRSLQAATRMAGVEIREGFEVRSLTRDGRRVTGVAGPAGIIRAGWIVVAAGAWASQIDDGLRRSTPVYPVRGQMVLLEMPDCRLRHIIERGRCYIVPRLDGRILVGATQEHDSGFEKRNTAEGIGTLLALAQRLVPSLATATFLGAWSGLRPCTPDRRPYIGPVPGCEYLIAACGHFRSGVTLAPITSHIVADVIVRGRTDWDLASLAPGRQLKTPPTIDDVVSGLQCP